MREAAAWGLGALLVVAALLAFFRHQQAAAFAEGPGQVQSALFVPTVEGGLVLAVERVRVDELEASRVTTWDARTGERRSVTVEVPWQGCAGAGVGRAWCVDAGGRVSIVALPGFEVLADQPTLEARSGGAWSALRSLEVSDDGQLKVARPDGAQLWVDPQTWAAVTPGWRSRVVPTWCPVESSQRVRWCGVDTGGTWASPQWLE